MSQADSAPLESPPWWAAWLVAVLGYLYYLSPLAIPLVWPGWPSLSAGEVALQVVPGTLALVALVWRRQRPLLVALVVAVLWVMSSGVIGAAVVAQEHLARRARRATVIAVAVVMLAGQTADMVLAGFPPQRSATMVEWTLAAAGIIVATLVGLLRVSDGQERLRRAEAQRARREAEAALMNAARLSEREQIAREMHDVVAHRISLIALHAGALAHRRDADPDQARELARMIQTNAQASLDELRAMVTTLRGAHTAPAPPQPTLADLDALVADAGAVGQQVALQRSGDLARASQRVSRHAYRIIQECLTNARKHAPGAPVSVTVAVTGTGVHLRVANPLTDLVTRIVPGAGLGLVGIVERVEQVGGVVTHGHKGGEFVLEAELPFTRPATTTSGGA